MNLNLGLESLTAGNYTVFRNTESNSTLFNACDIALESLSNNIDNLFDAAKNAVAVRKALKQFGKTQSIVALVGNEGLSAAQSFSMEGFWAKAKEILVKIWQKICEWWNRFWSIFFSNEKKMNELASATGTLARPVEYDGVDIKPFNDLIAAIKADLPTLKEKVVTVSGSVTFMNASATKGGKSFNLSGTWNAEVSTDMSNADGADRGSKLGLHYIHVKLVGINEVKARAKELAKILKNCKDLQKKIDEVSKKALESAKKMSEGQAQEATIANSKQAAKYMRDGVQQVYREANAEAAKLSAHTSITK